MSAGLRAGTSNDGYLQINGTDVLTALSSGRIGIGTSNPLSKFNILGTQGNWRIDTDTVSLEIQLLTSNTNNTGFLDYRIRTNQTTIDTNGVERLRIASTGNVGIGTTNPQAKLDVNGGNARFGRSGISILVRNANASVSGATIPATFVACTTDGGSNLATTYWTQNYGASQGGSCLGAFTATDTYVSPSSSVSYGATIYGIVGRY